MVFKDWLAGERGRMTRVAQHFGITLSAVSQWAANGVPADRLLDVRDITGGAVTVEEMLERTKPPQREAA